MNVEDMVGVVKRVIDVLHPDNITLFGYGKPVKRMLEEDGYNVDNVMVNQSPGLDVSLVITFKEEGVGRLLDMVGG